MCHGNTEKYQIIQPPFDKGYIDGATTRLCIPAKKRAIRVMQLIVKKGWFHNDEKKETYRTKREHQKSFGQQKYFDFIWCFLKNFVLG